MKHNSILTIASLLSILLMTLHLTSDTVHARVGTAEAGGSTRCGAHPGRLVVRNVGARRTAVGVHHHACQVAPCVGHARYPRDGSGRRFSRPDRQVQPSLLVRLDASRARRDWDVLPHPLGTRNVEPAMGPVPVVRQKENVGRSRPERHGSRCTSNPYSALRVIENAWEHSRKV